MPFFIQVAARSDVGQVRTNNEDNFGYDLQQGIFIVCDGMGGQACGEVASKVAVQAVLDFFKSEAARSPLRPAELLAQSIAAANAAVRAAEREHEDRTGMGTTIVALLVRDHAVSVAHVGDSRIYLARGGTVMQLTDDHSLVAEQVRRGVITPEQAESSAWQHVLIRAIGAADQVEVDTQEFACEAGDVYLLATDGLMNTVADQEIADIINSPASVEAMCDELIRRANANGGDDNVTCIVVRAAKDD